ncbi:MAG: DotU family type VI secretion system protein [Caldimonas sp.]
MSDTGRENDPFAAFESDRTVIKPGTGRGAPLAAPGAAPQGQGPGRGAPPGGAPRMDAGGGKEAPLALDALMSASLNPLVSAASPLLSSAPRIRAMVQHANPAGLKEALADGIRKFEQQARSEGLPNEQVIAARYILCTLLDESAASTPWGGSGVWSGQSLLVLFHNETWGGEKVFQLMSKLAENVPANRNLLELMYVALAFGFEGRYRVLNDGRSQLESLRARLSQMLRGNRADTEKTLSPRWEGVPAQVARLRDGLPMWVVASLAGLLLLGVYLGLTYSLNNASDNVFTTLQGLDVKAPAMTAPPPPPPPADAPRLATFLKGEIEQGLVQVRDLSDRSIVIIKGDGFFEPGSSVIADRTLPLLARIAEGLKATPGTVLITGHTDNQPIRTLRYPSNWHLSQDRANAVKTVLGGSGVKPERIRAEGKADAEPVDPSPTPAGRARNRRVEITLIVPSSAA